MAFAKTQNGPDQNLSSENACTTKIKLSALTGLHVDTCIRCADAVLCTHVVVMAAIIISSGSKMSDSDDSKFESWFMKEKAKDIKNSMLMSLREAAGLGSPHLLSTPIVMKV